MKVVSSSLMIVFAVAACVPVRHIDFASRMHTAPSGSEFYNSVAGFAWRKRDSIAVREILNGNVPDFMRKFQPIKTSLTSPEGMKINATYYVSPDYLSIGSNDDWARIPLTPMAAQIIADSLDCFLPTRKIVNDIYAQSVVKLEPIPLLALRDSTPTLYHHHLIIEGQRKSRKGLIAGIKKDVVISTKVVHDNRPNRVAIYGWHKPDGKPIQPVYTGHVNWYVDYSHGIRLVYRKVKVDGKWMDYEDVLNDPALRKLLCDEDACDHYRY